MRLRPYILSILVCLAACGPSTPPVDLDKELAALTVIRDQHRDAHLNRDPELLVSSMAADFRVIDEGKVSQPSHEEMVAAFRAYFEGSTFLAWDDIDRPIIRLSEDGTMASVIVHKRVSLVPRNAPTDTKPEDSEFAWLETWEKIDGTWKLKALSTTRKPAG